MTCKVLLLSLYHPELVRGGAQQVCYELFEELRATPGFRPFLLAAIDNLYPSLFKSGARITGFDGREDEFVFLSQDYDYWWHRSGEPLLIETFIEFLHTIQPDVVHFHHFLAFGIDLVSVVRRTLPCCRIVFTFHEFLSICAADGHMTRRTDRSLCNRASHVRCHQCFPDRGPDQFMLREMWFRKHLSHVDFYTCPSIFMIEHYVEWGLPRDKIFHVTNGQLLSRTNADGPPRLPEKRNRFGFFGQIHDDKGVHIILRAVRILRAQGFADFSVQLNGDNIRFASPEIRAEIEGFLAEEALLPYAEQIVVHNGSYHIDQLHERMSGIDWSIVPSIWWEIFGLVISEAWTFGKPVICSNVGGMQERVRDDVDGLHFDMGSPRSLAATMRRACTEDGLWRRLHDALPTPPTRAEMTRGYIELYLAPSPENRAKDLATIS
jgi:glycosyltransferase involved in cell wall biosynthesis